MNRTRVVLLGLLAVLVAVWVSSASLPSAPAESRAARAAASARPEPLPFDVSVAAERLRVQRRDAPSPRREGRNPFEFATRETPPPPAAAPPRPAAPSEPATPPPPPLTLSGIVDKTVGDQKVRTAVISGLGGQLFFAKVGDIFGTRFEVIAITPDVVELRDIYTKQTIRLALR